MVFPIQNLPLPRRPFPFDPHACSLPKQVPDCHLVRTVIPCLPHYDSLGVFHRSASHPLASFARMVSKGNSGIGSGHQPHSGGSFFPAYSLKAGYTAHSTRFCAPPCRFIPGSYATTVAKISYALSSAQHQVSTVTGSYTPCHWRAPENLNPQHPP